MDIKYAQAFALHHAKANMPSVKAPSDEETAKKDYRLANVWQSYFKADPSHWEAIKDLANKSLDNHKQKA